MKYLLVIMLFIATFPVRGQQKEEQLARDFIELLHQEKFELAYQKFDEIVSSKISLTEVKTLWGTINLQAGTFKKIFKIESKQSGDIVSTTSLCEFERAYLNIVLAFNQKGQVSGIFFRPAVPPSAPVYQVPSYTKEENFEEIKLTVNSNVGELPAIYTKPLDQNDAPIIVMVHGSGPNDMDETVGPNKLFKDLSIGLANYGIGTLRYAKRTSVYPQSMTDQSTVDDEVVNDAIKAVALAKEQTNGKIYLLGHSLGGMMAPKIALESDHVHGVILMAGPARSMPDLFIMQAEYLKKNAPGTQDALYDQIYKVGIKLKGRDYDLNTPKSELLNISPIYWKNLESYSAIKTAQKLQKPTLVLQGKRDYQVTVQDFELWKETFGLNAEYKLYEKLNHMFLEGEGICLPAEYNQRSNVPNYVIDDLSEWINNF